MQKYGNDPINISIIKVDDDINALDEILSDLPEVASQAPKAEWDVISDDDDLAVVDDDDDGSKKIVGSDDFRKELHDGKDVDNGNGSACDDVAVDDANVGDVIERETVNRGNKVTFKWQIDEIIVAGNKNEDLDKNVGNKVDNIVESPEYVVASKKVKMNAGNEIENELNNFNQPQIEQQQKQNSNQQQHQQLNDYQQQHQQQNGDQQHEEQEDTVFKVHFEVSASLVEIPSSSSSSSSSSSVFMDDSTDSHHQHHHHYHQQDKQTSTIATTTITTPTSTTTSTKPNTSSKDSSDKTYIYEILQEKSATGNDLTTGSDSKNRDVLVTRVSMHVNKHAIDGVIERETGKLQFIPEDEVNWG
ncbi:hypothetical protein HELRODRAFT_169732 [Helobdella robusta]|uniref:Uncharacterized protein n=1 Tax=Helobdella robusta TaxID=6412 RepID=T1F2A2_HELRO|nr:hypothetical protein HELRODRAFT_169732 [Helobdella robusta]ESO08011.1 hypothetical protein HELRODRAFT_169732 [Helobdella robusta]